METNSEKLALTYHMPHSRGNPTLPILLSLNQGRRHRGGRGGHGHPTFWPPFSNTFKPRYVCTSDSSILVVNAELALDVLQSDLWENFSALRTSVELRSAFGHHLQRFSVIGCFSIAAPFQKSWRRPCNFMSGMGLR